MRIYLRCGGWMVLGLLSVGAVRAQDAAVMQGLPSLGGAPPAVLAPGQTALPSQTSPSSPTVAPLASTWSAPGAPGVVQAPPALPQSAAYAVPQPQLSAAAASPYVIPCAATASCDGGGPCLCTTPSPSYGRCENCGGDCVGSWRDNVEIWLVGDGFRDLGDIVPVGGRALPMESNFGLRTAINSGFALGSSNWRGQIGGSFGVFDFQGRPEFFGVDREAAQTQFFLTAGIYRRSTDDERVAWGLVYDQFLANNWGTLGQDPSVGQLRGLVSVTLNDCHAVGLRGAVGLVKNNDIITSNGVGDVDDDIETLNYLQLFWTRHFAFGGETELFIGFCDPSQLGQWMFGFEGRAPLSSHAALTAAFAYVAPDAPAGSAGTSEESWNFSAGVVFYLGGKAFSGDVAGRPGLPLLDVADNGSLVITRRE